MALVSRLVGVLLLVGVLVAYWWGLHLSRPSPLGRASGWQVVVTAAYGVLLVVVVSAVLGGTALLFDALARRLGSPVRAGSLAVCTLVVATFVLLFVDNLFYSLIGASLRNERGSPAKVAFVLLAVAPGLLWALRMRPPSQRVTAVVVVVSVLVSGAAVGLAATYLLQEEEPPPLVRVRDAPNYNVLILSADGINADAMSVYGRGRGEPTTPFLDSISDELMVYENAFSNNGNTTGSIVSLLSGRSPVDNGVVYPPDALSQGDARRTLPFLLGRLGYERTNWAVPHYVDAHAQNLVDAFDRDNGHPPSAAGPLPLGSGPARWFVEDLVDTSLAVWADALGLHEMDNPYDFVVSTQGSIAGDELRLEGISDAIGGSEPFFVNSHFMVSHGPYFRLPEGTLPTEQSRVWQEQHYRAAIRMFDRYVQRVFDRLRQESALEETIVVITSDHGQQYDARQRVPLLIRFPGGSPQGRVSANVQRLDVAPTILGQLGYEAPAWMTGEDLADPASLPPRRPVVATTVPERSGFDGLGVRPVDGALLVTTIVCRRYRQVVGEEVVAVGRVPGSTSPCR